MLPGRNSIQVVLASIIVTVCIQSTALAEESKSTRVTEIEEIVVFAQKREENILDVPVAVSVINGEEIVKRGMSDFNDLAGVTPGVFLTTSASSRATRINIRGITSTPTSVGFEPGISVSVDGVAQGRATTFNDDFLDIQAIEVLRGPQGTLYGRNSVAGAINIYTKKPTVEKLEATAKVGLGNLNYQTASGSLNVPMGDKAALRLSTYFKDRDGYLKNITTGGEHNNIDRWGIRGSLLVQPVDNLELILRATVTELDLIGNTSEPVATPGNIGDIDRMIAADFEDNQARDTANVSLEVNWAASNGFSFKSITAYSEYDFFAFNDIDFSNADFLVTGIVEDQNQFTQEFQISSPVDQSFSWIAGLYYFNQDLFANALADFGLDFPVPIFAGVRANAYLANIDTEAYAIFAQGEWRLTDVLSLIAGVRYTSEEKTVDYDQQNPFLPAFTNGATIKDEEPTGTLKLKYQPVENLTWYASISRGFKAGGFNLPGDLPSSNVELLLVDPEFVDTMEVGMRGGFLDNRMWTTVTAYTARYKDRQVFDLDFSGVIPTLVSANRSTDAKGLELEVNFSASDNFLVGGTYGYLDAKVDSPEPEFGGNVVERSPKNQFTLFGQYTVPMDSYQLRLWADYAHIDEWYDEDENLETAKQDAYDLLNMRLSFRPESERWDISLWVKNVSGEDYALDFLNNGASIFPNPGRLYGVDLQYNFGK